MFAGDLLPFVGHDFLHGRPAADTKSKRREIQIPETRRVQQSIEERVDASEDSYLPFCPLRNECRHIPRIGYHHVGATELEIGQRIHH